VLSAEVPHSQEYIKEVAALGNPLTKPYSITDQSNCPAVP
jgi:hypothetical protein